MVRAFVIIILLTPLAANADKEVARDYFRRGTKAYNLQEFDVALSLFKRAYVELPDPAFLFNIAQTQRQLGQYKAATKSYQAYLNERPDSSERGKIETLIRTMQEEEAAKTAAKEPTGTRAPAGQQPATPPQPAASPTTPPTSSTASPSTALNTSTSGAGRSKRIAGLVVGATGIGLLGGGLAAGLLAKSTGDDLTGLDQNHHMFDYDKQQTGKTDQIVMGVCLGVGAAAVIAGATLYLLGHKERHVARSLSPLSDGAASSMVAP